MRIVAGLSISLYSVVANGVKLLTGPITILMLSKKFSPEQIGFYYTFFSLISMQQLAELGLGHVLRQCISHAYKEINGEWALASQKKIKEYFLFGSKWFVLVALFIVFFVGPFGILYYSGYVGSVIWIGPWCMLILVSAFTTIAIPFQILIEATQNQKIVYQAQSLLAVINSLFIWLFIYLDVFLYAIPLALILSNLFFYLVLWYCSQNKFSGFHSVLVERPTLMIFKELWPLFSRVSIVWCVGFLFWNGFNLISFKIYNADYAGKVIFTLALARAGFGLADSIFSSQVTVVSNMISRGESKRADKYAKRYRLVSLLVLLIGYLTFIILWNIFRGFFVFNKVVNVEYCISIFLFFLFTLYLTTWNNYIRCFKVEPFVFISLFQGVMVPLLFYVSNAFHFEFYLYPCIFVVLCSTLFSHKISKKIVLE